MRLKLSISVSACYFSVTKQMGNRCVVLGHLESGLLCETYFSFGNSVWNDECVSALNSIRCPFEVCRLVYVLPQAYPRCLLCVISEWKALVSLETCEGRARQISGKLWHQLYNWHRREVSLSVSPHSTCSLRDHNESSILINKWMVQCQERLSRLFTRHLALLSFAFVSKQTRDIADSELLSPN